MPGSACCPIPDRLEDRVGEAQREQVLNGVLGRFGIAPRRWSRSGPAGPWWGTARTSAGRTIISFFEPNERRWGPLGQPAGPLRTFADRTRPTPTLPPR